MTESWRIVAFYVIVTLLSFFICWMHFMGEKVRGGSAGVIESVYGVIKPILIV